MATRATSTMMTTAVACACASALATAPAAIAQTENAPGGIVCALEPGSVAGIFDGDGADSVVRDLEDGSLLDTDSGSFVASGEIACGLVGKGVQPTPHPGLTDGWEITFTDATFDFTCGSTGTKNGRWQLTRPPRPGFPGVVLEGAFGTTSAAGLGALTLVVTDGTVGSDTVVGGDGDGALILRPVGTGGGPGIPGVTENVKEFELDGAFASTLEWEDS